MVCGKFTSRSLTQFVTNSLGALLRIWAKHDTHVGRILLRCYDRRRFRLYSAPQDFEFDTGKTLGTLSKLYDINF